MMSVHHKASVTEGGDEGVTWWVRACSADREAIVLLKSEGTASARDAAEQCGKGPRSCLLA